MTSRNGAGALLLSLVVAGGLVPSAIAHADPSTKSGETLRNALVKPRAPEVARFVSAGAGVESVGARAQTAALDFVVDRSGDAPRLRFAGEDEIFALDVAPAARGDEVFRFDTGEEFLRLPAVGAPTTYDASNPAGAPVILMGEAAPLPSKPEGDGETLLDALEALDATLVSRLGRLPDIDVPQVDGEVGVYADAVRVLERAVRRTDQDDVARARLATLRQIVIASGADAKARVVGDSLVITVASDSGYAGRPSSLRILAALSG